MIKTYSKFYYGQVVSADTQTIDFREGDVEKRATLRIGSYSLSGFVSELQYALNTASDRAYLVTVDRQSRKITIASDEPFDLLAATGISIGATAFRLAGFSSADLTGENSYEADLPCGFEYIPPFMLQDYLAPDDNLEAVDSVESESAAGIIQGVSFGVRSFVEFNIKWVRAENYSDGWITTTTESVNELRAFMRFAREKHPIEFIPDRKVPGEFITIRLDSTDSNRSGTGFKLKELHGQGMPGFFETGILKFRVL